MPGKDRDMSNILERTYIHPPFYCYLKPWQKVNYAWHWMMIKHWRQSERVYSVSHDWYTVTIYKLFGDTPTNV